jgi:hypothetical protein
MSNSTGAPAPRIPIGSGIANTRPGSNVDVMVPGEPMAFLRPETGEVIIVPAEDSNLLRSHYNGLSNLVAEKHSATRVLQLCEEYLEHLQLQRDTTREQVKHANEVLDFAIDWHDTAHDNLHAEYGQLDPLPDSTTNTHASPGTLWEAHRFGSRMSSELTR